MNEIFKKKSAIFYVISQNHNRKNINFKPSTGNLSPNNNENKPSQRYSLLFQDYKTYKNSIKQKLNPYSFSSTNNLLKDIINSSEIKSFYNLNQFQNRNLNKDLTKFFQKDKKKINNYSNDTKNEKNKLKMLQCDKLKNTTQIIQKIIRYHDLNAQTNKKKINNFYTPLLTKNNDNNKNRVKINYNEEKAKDDSYITVYGILFDENNKYNLNRLKKKKGNKDIIPNLDFRHTNLLKNNNNIKSFSLPWLIKKDNIEKRKINDYYNDLSKSKGKKSYFKDNDMSINKKNLEEKKDVDINKNNKTKKIIGYDMISIAGKDFGKEKVNQDKYFLIPKIDNCEEIKIFGIFDGHGDNGDMISTEIRDFFEDYFLNLKKNVINEDINENDKNENDKSNNIERDNNIKKKNIIINAINKFKKNNKYIYQNRKNIRNNKEKKNSPNSFTFNNKYSNKKINCNIDEERKININNFIKEKIKDGKIKKIYYQLSNNNYSQVFTSYKKINEILHRKFDSNKICYLSGSTSLIVFLINSKNCNKIITTNLGDSKIISISEDNMIKELNLVHTPNNFEEKNRILNNGGVISRIDFSNIGPLRIWYKDKKYPGLSITRSFGDFESDALGVISEPDIREYDIDEEKIKILVFGTDGIWKFLSNEKIMDIALLFYEQNDVNGAVNKISETAIKLWEIKNPKGIADVTVFVIFFK